MPRLNYILIMKIYRNFFYYFILAIAVIGLTTTSCNKDDDPGCSNTNGCDDNCEFTTDKFDDSTCTCENELVIPDCDDENATTRDTYDTANCRCVRLWNFSVNNYTEEALQEAMILMNDGDTISLGEGTYSVSSTLSVDGKNDIVIMGAGKEKTILDFSNQTPETGSGAEGLKFTNTKNSIVANLMVKNTAGDGIKAKDCESFSFINVSAIWEGEAKEENGAYGIYPTTCKHVLVDGCYAKGASDAGLYIGQCEYVIMRNSVADNNVAGIEFENTRWADVYNCTATNNTAGILVFDLPGLPAGQGHTTRVFNNIIQNNNYKNFAPGGTVADVPPGTGIMLMAASTVEVFNNSIENNYLMSIGIVDYEVMQKPWEDNAYISYPRNLYIHDNAISSEEKCPEDPSNQFGTLLSLFFPDCINVPPILWDGITSLDELKDNNSICVQNSGPVVDLDLPNFDITNFPGDQVIERDVQHFNCTKESLAEVAIEAPILE